MKKLKYLLLILPFLFIFNVSAQNVTSSVRCSYNGTGSTYYGDPNDGFNSARCFDFGTRYSPRLGYIEFYLPTTSMTFTANTSYTVTMNMATNDWRNNIMLQNVRYVNSSGSVITSSSSLPTMTNFRFISRKQIKFDFRLPSGTVYPYLRFILSSPTYGNPDPDISSSTFMTGDSNWNLSSIDISPVNSSSGGSSGGSSGSSYDDSGIINNNNQNTSDIINNNNNNTQEIIDNQNKNIDSINQQLGTCHTNIFNKNNFDNSVRGFKLSGLTAGKQYKFYSSSPFSWFKISTSANGVGYYEYAGSNKQILIFTAPANVNNYYLILGDSSTWSNNSLWFYNNASLMMFKSPFPNDNIDFISYNEKQCTSKLDDTNNAINDTNSYLKDDSDPNINDNEFTDLFNTVGFNDPLGYLLQLPVQFINRLVSQSNTCQTISLGTLWGVSLSLPCINIGSIVGQQVWDIIDVLFSVGLLVVIFKNLYQTFANLMTMGGEKEAREKFSMPTPMEFLSTILGGDR